MSCFPKSTEKRVSRCQSRLAATELHCKCRIPYNKSSTKYEDQMLECSQCLEWYHVSCENIPAKLFDSKYKSEIHTCIYIYIYIWVIAVNYFRKKLHLRCLTWFWICLWYMYIYIHIYVYVYLICISIYKCIICINIIYIYIYIIYNNTHTYVSGLELSFQKWSAKSK